MCGDRMTLKTRETLSHVPGTSQEIRTIVREWVCQDCDYFEEAEEADEGDRRASDRRGSSFNVRQS
jgi:hypothetical protein